MGVRELIAGGVVTLIIGGGVYTVNQQDVVDNFADDTGLTQQQAEEYVGNIKQEDLVSYSELGNSYINDGNQVLAGAAEIDCVNYEYDWQSPTLSCELGKSQLIELGNDEVALGNSYIKLSTDNATTTDINKTINLLTEVNLDYDFEIVRKIVDFSSIDETKKTNSYNKSLLQAALEGGQQ